ncbi:unnamed protein product [Closterium sp. NIES-65]|nr:unnamed protein product [Closterium sp. NIES-65]
MSGAFAVRVAPLELRALLREALALGALKLVPLLLEGASTGVIGAVGPGGARTGGTGAAGAGGSAGPGGAAVFTEAGYPGAGGARSGGGAAAGTGSGGAGAGGSGAAVGSGAGGGAGAGDAGAGDSGAAGGAGTGAVFGTHLMALHPSSAPQRVPLSSPPASSLPNVPDPESDCVRAAHPTVTRLLATVVTDPSFESTAASALVAELVDFAAACRLDFAASLVAGSESVCPPSVGGECALGTDVLEDRQEDFERLAAAVPHLVAMLLAPEGDPDAPDIPTPHSYAEAIAGEYSSQWQTTMDAEMASWKVKRPPGSPPVFKARYFARGFSQRQGVDFFQTFSPTLKMATLWVLLHVAAQRD